MPDNLRQIDASEGEGVESGSLQSEEPFPTFPSVPPPPAEVKIRTMQSDLEQMMTGGGVVPHFEVVKAPRLGEIMRGEEERPKRKPDIFWIIAAILAAALLGGIIYFSYVFFSGERGAPRLKGGHTPGVSISPRPQTLPEPEFVHQSFLNKPADEVLTFVRQGRVESAAELETFSQRLLRVLAGAKSASRFIEIRFQDEGGRDLRVDEVLALPDALVLAPEFLLDKFNPDPTAFVYRAGGSFWLGYIFALKPSENWLFLKDDVAKLELSPKIENFFLQSPGVPAAAFEDVIISEQPARKLTFSSGLPAQASAAFVYGWFRGNLILSASEEGFKEALARL